MYRQKFREYKQILRSTTILLATVAVLTISSSVSAQLTPPGNPNSPQAQMPSLDQIHQKLTTGSTAPIQTGYVGPSGGPTYSTMYSLNQLMDLMPALDNDDCARPEDVLNGKRYWGLCSDNWGPRTGTASSMGSEDSIWPAPVAATGQTVSFATGDDGEHQAGVAWPTPRFTDNSDGTVTDNLTGLIWLKNANCAANLGGVNKTGSLTWADSLTWSNALGSGHCGLSDGSSAGDWRLPGIHELESLIDYGITSAPRIPAGHPFTGTMYGNYWSSSTYAGLTSFAWHLYLPIGFTNTLSKTTSYYVWPVR